MRWDEYMCISRWYEYIYHAIRVANSSYQALVVFSCRSSKELDSWRQPDSFTITQNSSWPSYWFSLRSNKKDGNDFGIYDYELNITA